MASTFHDSAQASNGASGTTLSTADALAVTINDLVHCVCKWESPATPTCTVDTGGSTPLFTTAVAKMTPAGWGAVQSFFWIADSTGTVNPRMVLNSNSDGREIRAMSFTPDAGITYSLGNTNTGFGTSAAPNTGSAASTGAAVIIAGFGMFASADFSPLGTGWSSPAEFGATSANAEYRIEASSGTFTGDGTWSGACDWFGQIAVFNEIQLVVGATQIPFVGSFGRGGARRSRYPLAPVSSWGRFAIPTLAERMRYAA